MNEIMTVATELLTPTLVAVVALTLAAAHTFKIMAEHWLRQVTASASRWRAFCAAIVVGVGVLVGTGAWLATPAAWYIIPTAAFIPGPAWSMLRGALPARMADQLLTATDRRYQGNSRPKEKT